MTDEPTLDPNAMVGRSKWLTNARLEILRRDYPQDHPWEGPDGLIARLVAVGGPVLPKKGVMGFVVHSFGLRRTKAAAKQAPQETHTMSNAPAGRTTTDRILSAVGRLLERDMRHIDTVPVTMAEVAQYASDNRQYMVVPEGMTVLDAVNAYRAEQEVPPFRIAQPMNPAMMPSSRVGGYQPRRAPGARDG